MTEDELLTRVSIELDAAMRDAGLSQERLARRARIAPNTILRVTKGYNARLSTIAALADGTGCDIELRFVRRNHK